jgi:predicted ATPase
MLARGTSFALKGSAAEAVETITSAIAAWRTTGSTMWTPAFMSELASAHAGLGQFGDAWRCIDEALSAIKTTKERWYEAEVNRVAGEIALKSPEEDAVKSGSLFSACAGSRAKAASKVLGTPRRDEHGATLARPRQVHRSARSSRSGLWLVHRSFDTRDLKEAKGLLDALSS